MAAVCDLIVVGPRGTVAAVDEPIGTWRSQDSVAQAGALSGLGIERAVALAQAGVAAGLVTAPIDKAALLAGGYDFPGHTEMLAPVDG